MLLVALPGVVVSQPHCQHLTVRTKLVGPWPAVPPLLAVLLGLQFVRHRQDLLGGVRVVVGGVVRDDDTISEDL